MYIPFADTPYLQGFRSLSGDLRLFDRSQIPHLSRALYYQPGDVGGNPTYILENGHANIHMCTYIYIGIYVCCNDGYISWDTQGTKKKNRSKVKIDMDFVEVPW